MMNSCACNPHSCQALRQQRIRPAALRLRRTTRCTAEKFLQVEQSKPGTPTTSGTTPVVGNLPSTNPQRTAVFKATKHQALELQEREKPLASYMALPASQYSVLDAKKIVRLDDTTFKCYVGGLKFASWTVEPVLTVSVVVEEQGCTIKLLSCELAGPPLVEQLNSKFQASMTNVVRYQDTSIPTSKAISSDTTVEVCVEIPGWCSFIPASAISSTGSSVMQTTLNVMVPRFLQQLEQDYKLWAAGDESRRPVGEL